jgi:hypothetical protein
MVVVKKGFENSEVTFSHNGITQHAVLATASQEILKRLKEIGYEGVEDKKSDK